MSAFETYVNIELPRRPTLLTYAITSYDGDPNDVSAPSIVQNSPAGTLFLRNTSLGLYRKQSASSTSWVQMQDAGGSLPTNVLTKSGSNLTYYVSTSGNDSNDGLSSGTPLRNIQTALDKLPTINNGGTWIINIAPGTYSENLFFPKILITSSSGTINITSTGWTTYVPATGISTGTFDDGDILSFYGVLYCEGGWDIDDLSGKFLYINSGSNGYNGKAIPIYENDDVSVFVGKYDAKTYLASTPYFANFTLVTPGVTIQPSSGTTVLTGGAVMSTNLSSTTLPNLDSVLLPTFTGIKFIGTIELGESALRFDQCLLTSVSNATGGVCSNRYAALSLCCVNSTKYGLNLVCADFVSINESVLLSCSYGVKALGTSKINILNSIFDKNSTILYIDGPTRVYLFHFNGQSESFGSYALRLFNGVSVDWVSSNLINYLAAPVLIEINNSSSSANAGCHIRVTGATGQDSSWFYFGGRGIQVYGTGSTIDINGATSIEHTGVTGGPIYLGMDRSSVWNRVLIQNSVSITHNLSLNGGTTTFTLSSLKTEADKRYVDLSNFNIALVYP